MNFVISINLKFLLFGICGGNVFPLTCKHSKIFCLNFSLIFLLNIFLKSLYGFGFLKICDKQVFNLKFKQEILIIN